MLVVSVIIFNLVAKVGIYTCNTVYIKLSAVNEYHVFVNFRCGRNVH